jgi:hypothetical protein
LDSFQGLYNMLEHIPKNYHGIDLAYQSRIQILPTTGKAGQGFFPYSPPDARPPGGKNDRRKPS